MKNSQSYQGSRIYTSFRCYKLLVGQGEDKQKLKEKVKQYDLEKDVLFSGVQNDIQAWLSSFDLFLFPSKFEGLGIAALEAQVNGLPVIASNGVIPVEVKMNENFEFLGLEEGIEEWSTKIDEMRSKGRLDYQIVKSNFVSNGYDIETEGKKLERLLVG